MSTPPVDDATIDECLRHLSAPGQRVLDYENAQTEIIASRDVDFTVLKRGVAPADGPLLQDFPTEVLIHIISHLYPDSHASVALVSKRFYTLSTSPHAWRMAFQRYFRGEEGVVRQGLTRGAKNLDEAELIRPEIWSFAQLTTQGSWKSEYLVRTRLLRSLARGAACEASQPAKKANAVLTYNSRLPCAVTSLHAVLTSTAKKPPRVMHGASLGIASTSDPQLGKVESWGRNDGFLLDEMPPDMLPYGLDAGPAAGPNVVDVSVAYGLVAAEGLPGGRVFHRPSGASRGKYLGREARVAVAGPATVTVTVTDTDTDIPHVPELTEAFSAVWLAKSATVPALTQSMIGILTGSTLGIITAYSIGYHPSGPRYANGGITARWVLSPGVPIIAIQVDESYSHKRKALGRVWAVALNALGELYYLTETPTPLPVQSKPDSSTKCAWYAGRSAYWHLAETTRRRARADESDPSAVRGRFSPRSSADALGLTRHQLVEEAREIEKYLRHKPAHFRKVCDGWDMCPKLEVDFAGEDGDGAGEHIFVLHCGIEEGQAASVQRYTRAISSRGGPASSRPFSPSQGAEMAPSLFGDANVGRPFPSYSTTATHPAPSSLQGADEWRETAFALMDHGSSQITACCIDSSLYATMLPCESASKEVADSSRLSACSTLPDVPGGRARLLAVGSNTGVVLLWNMREKHACAGVQPVRVIRTESPVISCLAMTALYLVHGGSCGLAQAWDLLGSSVDPVRTLCSRAMARMPQQTTQANTGPGRGNPASVGAIYLDPDPRQLRGVLTIGSFIRYWAYSSSGQPSGRKRRLRHSDISGRLSSRRSGGGIQCDIAQEADELRLEQEHEALEEARLRSRFGRGFADLTEEEALQYAVMISQESTSPADPSFSSMTGIGSDVAADMGCPPDRVGGVSTRHGVVESGRPAAAGLDVQLPLDTDFEVQIQQAMRLSLCQGPSDAGQSSLGPASSSHTTSVQAAETWPDDDDDFQLALKLSLGMGEDQVSSCTALGPVEDEFPPLGNESGKGKGKGKGKASLDANVYFGSL